MKYLATTLAVGLLLTGLAISAPQAEAQPMQNSTHTMADSSAYDNGNRNHWGMQNNTSAGSTKVTNNAYGPGNGYGPHHYDNMPHQRTDGNYGNMPHRNNWANKGHWDGRGHMRGMDNQGYRNHQAYMNNHMGWNNNDNQNYRGNRGYHNNRGNHNGYTNRGHGQGRHHRW